MLDLRSIRRDYDGILKSILRREKGDFGLSKIKELEEKRRELLVEFETLKSEQNSKSKLIPEYKRQNKEVKELLDELKVLSDKITNSEKELNEVETTLNDKLLYVPNILQQSVPDGKDEESNEVLRKWGNIKEFNFEPKTHWDLGKERDFLDFERGAKVSGSRFTFVKGNLAKLERALMNYFLDFHTNSGKYLEIGSPVIANEFSMIGTGQLPKFSEDMYKLEGINQYLIPTAEVTLTNFYSNEILEYEDMPKYLTGFTQCFRKEAGSAGRDTKGIIRQHQFGKVELVKLTKAEESIKEHEDMINDVEKLLQSLEIPYQVVNLCAGDVGFSSSKTIDIEIWFPSTKEYREVSSISNFKDFQARRINLRYRNAEGKLEYIHTLNGSGIPTGRTLAAIIENYQTEEGKIKVPNVLKKYMGDLDEI